MDGDSTDHLRVPGRDMRRGLVAVALTASVAAGSAFVVAAAVDSSVPLVVTLVLIGLASVSAHREAVFADETAVSGSMVVICACIVGLGGTALAAPLVCAVAAALHRDHLRDRHFVKLAVNLGATVLPAFLATCMFRAFGASIAQQVAGAVFAVIVYWLLNNAIVGIALCAAHGEPRQAVVHLIRSDTVMLVFAFGGGICGVVMAEVGVWAGLSTLVALLVALDVFVISVPAGLSVLRRAWAIVLARGVSGGVAGTVGAVVTRGLAISALGAIAGLVAGMVAGALVIVLIVGARLLVRHRHVDLAVLGGLVTAESAFPVIGATCGVAVAVAGLSTGLVISSGVVVVGSLAVAWRRRSRNISPPADDDVLMVAVFEAMLDGLPSQTRDR
jgi:hypothetical protein